MRTLALLLALLIHGCVTPEQRAMYDRCNSLKDGVENRACWKSYNQTLSLKCYEKYFAGDNFDETRWDVCITGRRLTAAEKQRLDCDETTDPEARKACEFAIAAPIEAWCEQEAAKHGNYWECVRIHYERLHRGEQIRFQYQQAQQQREMENARQIGDAIQKMGDAFKPAPATTCSSSPNGSGGVTTTCRQGH